MAADHLTLDDLIAFGFATRQPAIFTEPLTRGGYYTATNGYSYGVSWVGEKPIIAEIGYSAAYRQAEQAFEHRHGPIDDESWERFSQFLLTTTGKAS